MLNKKNPRLGELITTLVKTLAAAKRWDMAFAVEYVGRETNYGPDTVYRWRQGRHPLPETVEILTRIGKVEAGLPREWGESLLQAVHHPDTVTIVNNLWGALVTHAIPCNLPSLVHTEFVGRQAELARLMDLLSPQYGANLIMVDGIGGVGKTALVLEVAYRCWKASTGEIPNPKVPTFEAIIFVSAKQQYLTADGILPRHEAQRTLHDLFREVAHVLNRFDLTRAAPQDQFFKMREALARQRTLLIMDNLETMEDMREVISFLFELPPTVKVIVTTRERTWSYSPLRLKELPEEEALRLIEKQAYEKEAFVSKEQSHVLYERIGGIPAALIYALGQIAAGYSVETILQRTPQKDSDVARFCFEGSVAPLRGKEAHQLLMSLAMFPTFTLRSALASAAGMANDPITVDTGLARLRQISLVNQRGERYWMLPLTREYSLAELTAHAEFEQKARHRWVKWYLDFTKKYGGDDWMEWHIAYDQIEEEWENLLAVFEWCVTHEEYEAMRTFWQLESTGSVLEFSYIYGYWNDRLMWLDWLIQAAERRGDWTAAVDARSEAGFTLTLMGKYEKAETHLKAAWELQGYAAPEVQVGLMKNRVALSVYQRHYSEALSLLKEFLALLEEAKLDKVERARRRVDALYYQGIMYYREKKYEQAEVYFREMITQTQTIGWQRATIYAQNFLADIAIAQGRLDEAESLLQPGLTISERNKDRRRTALFQSSFAQLYMAKGEVEEVPFWARKALDGFERLGMQREVEEMKELLELVEA